MKETITLLSAVVMLMIQSCDAQKTNKTHSKALNLDSLVENLIINKSIPSIAIGIVKDGEIVHAKAYGYAHVEAKNLSR